MKYKFVEYESPFYQLYSKIYKKSALNKKSTIINNSTGSPCFMRSPVYTTSSFTTSHFWFNALWLAVQKDAAKSV
jgi:hypothetical protein